MGMVKLLFSFQGRISRSQYWIGGLIMFAVMLIAIVGAVMQIGGKMANGGLDFSVIPMILFLGLLYLAGIYCGAALNVKRLHDRGRTGFITLLAFVPALMMLNTVFSSGGDMGHMLSAGLATNMVSMLINLYFFVDLGLMPGKPEPNQYGDPPRPGSHTSPPPVRAAGGSASGAAPSFALDTAQSAMERAIAAQSAPRNVRVQSAPTPAPRPGMRAQPTPTAAPANFNAAPTGPKAFGRRV